MDQEIMDQEMDKSETMADYEAELEASFKTVKEGDILTGTVISVDDDQAVLDLKYYAEGSVFQRSGFPVKGRNPSGR